MKKRRCCLDVWCVIYDFVPLVPAVHANATDASDEERERQQSVAEESEIHCTTGSFNGMMFLSLPPGAAFARTHLLHLNRLGVHITHV